MVPGYTPRRSAGLAAYENVLARAGLAPVAGIDEAGRGACAGPLVVAAVVLDRAGARKLPGIADSKLLTPAAREAAYDDIVRWALDWHVVTIPVSDIDRAGLHVCNIEGMRRAYAGLRTPPGYVLTDGFPVDGLGPRGGGAHTPEEFVLAGSLRERAEVAVAIAIEALAGPPDDLSSL